MNKLLSLLLLTGTLFAQANSIFTLNPSVHSAGAGNSGIADLNSKNLFHNPAFAGLESHQETSYVKWLPNLADDMGYQNLQYTSGMGFSADIGGIITGEFDSSSLRVGGSYAMELGDWLLGARLNLYNHSFIDDIDIDMNYGVDIGAYKVFGNTSLGLVLKDLGGETKFADQSSSLPMS